MTDNTSQNWPFLRMDLPESADQETASLLTQAAVDAGALGGLTEPRSLLLYLPQDSRDALIQAVARAALEEAEALGWGALHWEMESLPDEPWATAWKASFVTTPIGRRLLIRPDWEQGQPVPSEWSNRLTVWLRPGFGFGTGRHETTRLALEMLESHVAPGARMLDMGSGSGILSIAAIRLGAAVITAIEFDADSNQNARENLDLNGCLARVYIHETNEPASVPGRYDLIICNMLPQNALQHFVTLASQLADTHASFIYSGFLVTQQAEIEAALIQAGLVPESFSQLNEWGAIFAAPAQR